MLIIDAHLDLSMNALEWNRDLKRTAADIRARESNLTDKPDRGKGTVSLPELRKGKIGLVVATQIARFVAEDSTLPGWHSPEQAWAQTQGQLAWYKAMETEGEMVQITNTDQLEHHIQLWNSNTVPDENKPVGFILSLEGADSLVNLSYLEKAWQNGLRALGPAHYGPGRYAPGTGMEGPLTPAGVALLKKMEELNIILDITHLTDGAFMQAVDLFNGHIWASHHNCRALVPHQRQLTDEQIRILIERGSVIGGVLDTWMLMPGWILGKHNPKEEGITLNTLINHYDHICQIAGNSNHIAIGSDLDGMFGLEQSPCDINTIADIQQLKGLLAKRGYSQSDIENVFHGNWLRFLRNAWK
ncbi:membrane dipeptidase [Agriterribacter sp.]|uniref:dipeptidase n=1 Tax=Agriterribacter sp. TaxID=2821509 RepID=UPI002C99F5F0|nr:membrane dipeptidase [Agriterribacter sp.]HRO47159.1 membrane dipeptidase [Agriterribacter sp.]HRQ17891.1 membrane dipeptidase [Agriterribacter sp.]